MGTIKVHDKYFEPFIPFEQIDESVQQVADQINADYIEGEIPIFLVILNGSFMFAGDLFKKINFPCEISFIKLSSYTGTRSSAIVKELIGLDESLKGRKIIVVEDIIDSGITMEKVISKLKELGVGDVKLATLLFKPDAFTKSYPIDYIGIEIPNDFIVGYGLDYDAHGRNLKDIYKIVE